MRAFILRSQPVNGKLILMGIKKCIAGAINETINLGPAYSRWIRKY